MAKALKLAGYKNRSEMAQYLRVKESYLTGWFRHGGTTKWRRNAGMCAVYFTLEEVFLSQNSITPSITLVRPIPSITVVW